jgi:ATP-dependent DNA helicase DinG
VVANHALVMVQAALGGGEDGRPLRLVFDEGHHLFDAADAAFSADLTAARRRSCAAGCSARKAGGPAPAACRAGWRSWWATARTCCCRSRKRCRPRADCPGPAGHPAWRKAIRAGAAEAFLQVARRQVLARTAEGDAGYGLEMRPAPAQPRRGGGGGGPGRGARPAARPLQSCATG